MGVVACLEHAIQMPSTVTSSLDGVHDSPHSVAVTLPLMSQTHWHTALNNMLAVRQQLRHVPSAMTLNIPFTYPIQDGLDSASCTYFVHAAI